MVLAGFGHKRKRNQSAGLTPASANAAGPDHTFTVIINDGGEPGAGNDTFSLDATLYTNGGNTMLMGGNIQSHPNCR